MPLPEGKGQPVAHVVDPGADPLLAQAPDGLQLGPARGHIHADEGGQEEALGGLAAVEHQIALKHAGADRRPLAPGAEGNLALEGSGGRRSPRLATDPTADRLQQAVDGRGAEPLQLLAQGGGEGQGAVPLDGSQEQGEQRGEQLAAEAIAELPEAD